MFHYVLTVRGLLVLRLNFAVLPPMHFGLGVEKTADRRATARERCLTRVAHGSGKNVSTLLHHHRPSISLCGQQDSWAGKAVSETAQSLSLMPDDDDDDGLYIFCKLHL